MQIRRLLSAIVLGSVLTLILLGELTVTSDAVRADPGILYAAKDCTGIPTSCYTTIQEAVNAAVAGDTIRVLQGTYLEAVLITKSLTLEGGWSTNALQRDWNVYTTTIDAQRSGAVIQADGQISPTIEGFILTGGDASAPLGWGGGILILGDWGGAGLAIIRHNVITNNVACALPSSCQGYGGGIMVYSSRSIIEHNTVISNLASVNGHLGGQGGGIAIWGHPGESTIAHNVILSNTALYSATSALVDGQGGGIWSDQTDSVIVDNDIRGNVAAVRGEGRGGGVYAGGDLYDNRILSNTASITNGAGYGGGVYAHYVPGFDNNRVQGNLASPQGDGSGGGVYAIYLQQAQYNEIVENVATRGGGVYFQTYTGNQLFNDNLVTHNRATGTLVSTWDGGGGIASEADRVEISRNRILSNTSAYLGGGVLLTGGSRYSVKDNLIEENQAGYGGGAFVYSATGTIAHNRVASNTGLTAGGGIYLYTNAGPMLDGNVVLSNTSSLGGGFFIYTAGSTPVTLTNQMIARNNASASGAGIHVNNSRGVRLFNNTLADNNLGSNQEGVKLLNSSQMTMTNNAIVGHSVAISVAAGSTAVLTRNDYWDNTIGVFGQISGTTDMTLDPLFDNRAAGDYHLALNSPLIDRGDNNVNVPYDFEGDPRPRGSAIDVGADEAYRSESYVSPITGSDLIGDGSAGNPFATVTRGLTETRTDGTVYVGRSTYTERITITRSVNLLGGYRETDWSRDLVAYGTTLNAARTGTVVFIAGEDVQATVEGFTITGGEASVYGLGGGLAIFDGAEAVVRANTIVGNHASNGGGGIMLWGNENVANVVDSNRIYNNVADGVFSLPVAPAPQSPQQGPEPGGGLLVVGAAQVVNNWVYSNTSGFAGDGLALSGEGDLLQAYHNTIVDNGGSSGEGVWLGGNEIHFYNNLIVGHGVGITGSLSALISWDHNGFYDNIAAYAPGLIAGLHDVNGNPSLVNRAGHDYHIGPTSPLAGTGLNLGVATDIDGDVRPAPSGTSPDLGADEIAQRRVYLPVIMRN